MKFAGSCLVVSIAIAVSACASLEQPGLNAYEDIRAAIVLNTDPATGVVTASSEPVAKEDVRRVDIGVASIAECGLTGAPINSQRRREIVFVQAERRPGGETQVYVVHRRNYPIPETDLRNKPWTETNPDHTGRIGDQWREVPWELVEFRFECPGSRLNCTRYATNRLKLSSDDVRALLQQTGEKIRLSFSDAKNVGWRLDADELRAVLDALGVTDQFRPA